MAATLEFSLHEEQRGGEELSSLGRFIILFCLIPILILRLIYNEIKPEYVSIALLKWGGILAYATLIHIRLKTREYDPRLGYLTLFVDSMVVAVSLMSLSIYKTSHIGTLNDSLYVIFYILGLGSALRFDIRYSIFSCSLATLLTAVLVWFDLHFHQIPINYNLIVDRILSLIALTAVSMIFARKFKDILISEHEQMRRHMHGISTIMKTGRNITGSKALKRTLMRITQDSADLTRSDFSYLMFEKQILAHAAPDIAKLKQIPADGFEAELIKSGKAVCIMDRDQLFNRYSAESTYHLEKEQCRHLMGVPIMAEKKVLGVLVVARRKGRKFDDYDQLLLGTMAEHAAQSISYANLFNEFQADITQAAPPKNRRCFEGMIGASEAMQAVYQNLEKAAPYDIAVLIRGESGSGKELAARALHTLSPRSQAPFIMVNCAAIPENLLESELFGYVKGAFSGAVRSKRGRFEMADHGTIFLDEIGDMSPALQTKLLRVIQEGELQRLGAENTITVDVRIITATHQNLEEMIAAGRFREDLYFRINGLTISMPSLNDRLDDIPLLSSSFLHDFDAERTFSRSAQSYLMQRNWPGNIRELKNLIQRIVVLSDRDVIRARDIAQIDKQKSDAGSLRGHISQTLNRGCQLKSELEEYEKLLISEALNKCQGNVREASRILGTPKSTLFDKIRRHEL